MRRREGFVPRRRGPLLAGAVALTLAAPAAAGGEVTLHEIRLPGKGAVDFTFSASGRLPDGASLEGAARVEGTRTRVGLSWKRMKPAVLFGGNVTSYAVWAVTREGLVENLGELFVKDPKGEATFSTGLRALALLVSAEPYLGVSRPSDLVVFAGGAPKSSKAESTSFVLTRLTTDARPARLSIASTDGRGGEPVELAQARAILAQAEQAKGGDPDLKTLREARLALSEATDPARRASAEAGADARRASALASAAIREVLRKRAAEEAARLEAERQAREEVRKGAVVDEAERRRQAEASLAEAEELRLKAAVEVEQTRQATAALAAARAQAEEERARLAEQKEALEREREAVASRLTPALETIATTASTPRGLVVTLPGAWFDPGRASLKPAARAAVAKLAGILLMVPERNVRIESHTDATGSAAANRRLSEERARNVAALLGEQGVPDERVSYEGYGAEAPLAPNTTAEGRARNRRVEIVVGEGTIPPAPREDGSPPR